MSNPPVHKLTEVLCAIWLSSNEPWDLTYFGIYFEKIKDLGFHKKDEQKGFQIVIDPQKNNVDNPPNATLTETRFIFRNETENRAIIIGKNYISFHQLEPYKNWDSLMSDIVKPGFQKYKEMGLGNNIIQLQSLYLNQFTLSRSERMSDHVMFLPKFDGINNEDSINFQATYSAEKNKKTFVSLNGAFHDLSAEKKAILQCGCFVIPTDNFDLDYLAKQAHDEANNLFNLITTKQS